MAEPRAPPSGGACCPSGTAVTWRPPPCRVPVIDPGPSRVPHQPDIYKSL